MTVSGARAKAPGGKRGRGERWLQVAAHVGALIPLALLLWDYSHHHLTANPIQDITFRTGKSALVLLVLSLACTPAYVVFGFRPALRLRRPLGLYAFLYAFLHFLVFTVLDYGLDTGLLREAIFEKRYALVGFSALLLLIPLAITSTRGWMRRLGKGWTRLHRLVYVAGLLVVVHYVWLVKADRRVPLLYGAVIGVLLLVRVPVIRSAIVRFRHKLEGQKGVASSGRGPAARPKNIATGPNQSGE
jgi:methionine sulfoxide reductase heme-binding subunit